MSTDDGFAVVLRLGEHLSRRSVSCPSGEYSVVHQHDGNVVVYRNADRFVVWASGTNFQQSVWNPDALRARDLDRAYGRPGRLALEEDGTLVVYSATNRMLWTSHSGDRQVTELLIHDAGRLVLRTERNTYPWSSSYPPKRWDGWNQVTDGRSLRRGRRLRNSSLVSEHGEYAFVVGEDVAAYLCRTDGEILWAVAVSSGSGYELTEDGRLITRSCEGFESPADSLNLSEPAAADLAARGAEELLVTDEGRLVLRDDAGAVLWTMEPPFLHTPSVHVPRKDLPKPQLPATAPTLPDGDELPVVRTDFSDDAAWQDAFARVSAEYGDDDPALSFPVAPIDDRRYENLTPDQIAALVPKDAQWPMLVLADELTMASPQRHMKLVDLGEDSRGPAPRATPIAILEMAINLWLGNMDWEDFAGDPDEEDYSPDRVLQAWNIPEPE